MSQIGFDVKITEIFSRYKRRKMFGKARSSIPVPGIKSGIPMKRNAQPTSTGRSTQAGTSSGIPVGPVASKVRKQTIILHVTTKLAFVIQLLN